MSYGTTDTFDRTTRRSTKELDLFQITQALHKLVNTMEVTSPRPNRSLAENQPAKQEKPAKQKEPAEQKEPAKLSVEQVKTTMSNFVNKQPKYLRYTAAIYLGRALEQYTKAKLNSYNFNQLKLAIDLLASIHQPDYLQKAEAEEKSLSYANRRLF